MTRFIQEQLKLGVIQKVAELEEADKVHYIPHLAVIHRGGRRNDKT